MPLHADQLSDAPTVPDRGDPIPHLGIPRLGHKEAVCAIEGRTITEEPVPLLVWRARFKELSRDHFEAFVQQLGSALHALHERGQTHIAVSPDHILVAADAGEAPLFFLNDELGVVDLDAVKPDDPLIDPWYAAPEALISSDSDTDSESSKHPQKWAWWSLGRTLQTLLVQEHILSRVLSKPVEESDPQDTEKARLMTTERLPGVVHGGVVESMGFLPPRSEVVLKGLLTQTPTARWTWSRIERWIQGEAPPEYYALPASTRLFHWRDHDYTIEDAAAEMARHADDGSEVLDQIFGFDNKHTLAAFVESPRGNPMLARKLKDMLQLASSATFSEYPPELVREVVGALGLMFLSKGQFRWRGDVISSKQLRETIHPEVQPEIFLPFELIAHPKILQQIHSFDAGTHKVLSQIARTADKARDLLVERYGFDFSSVEDRIKLWHIVLQPTKELRQRQTEFRSTFIRSDRPHLDDILKREALNQAELIVLILTAQQPKRYGYVSALEDAKNQRIELNREGHSLKQTLFWVRLEKASRFGLLLFARWPEWGGLLTIFAMVGFAAKPGPIWGLVTLAPIVFIVLARSMLQKVIARSVHLNAPEAAPWTWHHGSARCRREARAATGEKHVAHILSRIERVNEQLAKITILDPKPRPIRPPKRPNFIWLTAGASWIVVCAMSLFFLQSIVQHPPNWPEMQAAWSVSGPGMSTYDRSLRNRPPTIMDSDYKSAARVPATEDTLLPPELAFALARGRELVPYHSLEMGADRPIAIRLPGKTPIRVALYDPVADSLLREIAYVTDFEPTAGRTIILGGVTSRYYGP